MRWISFLISLLYSAACFAQVIENPVFDRTDIPQFHIDKIEITKDTTFVYCTYDAEEDSWANISPETYLEDIITGEKYTILKCEGLPFAPQRQSFVFAEKHKTKMSFPCLGIANKLNFVENAKEKAFNVYGIDISNQYNTSYSEVELKRFSNMASFYDSAGDTIKALQYKEKEIEATKYLYGINSEPLLVSLVKASIMYDKYGYYELAIDVATEEIENRKRIFGAKHFDYATSLSNLARFNANLGNYVEAIRLETEAIEILNKTLGTEHPEYALFLNYLAVYYYYIGNYAEAIKLQTEATEVYKKSLGSNNINYATSLGNLALYNSKLGNYAEAIRIETEAMEIRKKNLGTEHPDYAQSLNNLALYNSHLGNYAEAIRLGTAATEIRKKNFGTEHPDYAQSLNNLALYNSHLGNYAEAVRLGTAAMEVLKKNHETEHPDYALYLDNLAVFNANLGNYVEAIRLETEAKEIRKRVLGTEHPDYAPSLNNLAVFNSNLGNYAEAIRLEIEAMSIYKRVVGTEHPDYFAFLNDLVGFNFILGNYEKAYNYLIQQIEKSHYYIQKTLGELSSNYQKSLWTTQFAYTHFSTLPNLVSKYTNKESVSKLYNNTCLFAKGILLNTGIEMRKLILESGDSSLINIYNALSKNINIYNKLIEKPIKERVMNSDSLYNEIQKQEIELAHESKAYGDYTRNLTLTWQEVQRNLKDDDIAIELLDFPLFGTRRTMYVALTLKKGYDAPHMITLFDANQLNSISKDVYYTQTDISDLIWKPLEDELRGVKNIYFAPSGELHRIGIEYLPISKTKNISDEYTLYRLSSTRQIAVVPDETKGKNIILYGGLDYDEKSDAILIDSASVKDPVLRSAFSRANVDSLSLRSSFEFLEGTKKEADMIAKDMKLHNVPYVYYSGIDGTEESFKHLDGTKPKVMHIATHGFFLTEEEAEKSKNARSKIELLTEQDKRLGRPVEDKSMTRSGLLFSGCNHAINHEQIPNGVEDGILTAQEISMLDLRGLDLVVLSACQTGLGDVISGEGVFGLQRGFKKAGANTILMSLDKVDDEATRILMVEFYKNLMSGKTKHQSFKDAQKYLRQVDNGRYDNPQYWASFIMLDGLN